MAPISVLIIIEVLLMITGAYASNFLTSQPSQVNGSVTACAGEEISLTCGHDNAGSVATTWIISSPVNCSTEITHNPPTPVAPLCGLFSFQGITLAEAGVAQLNSTAVATGSREISGSKIECMAGFIPSASVGIISLCIIDELPAPGNPRCMEVPQGLSVSWDVVTDGCARSSIVYVITVVGEANRTITSVNDVEETNVVIPDSLLEPNQTYIINVRAKGTCETREEATVVCRTSDDLSPAAVTVPVETAPGPESSSDASGTVAAVVVVVLIIITAVIGIIIAVVSLTCYRHKHNKSNTNTERARVQNSAPLYEEILEPEADLEIATHQNAAYLDIKSTRVNRNAGASVSMARSTPDATSEGHLYTEISEADDKLPEIPINQGLIIGITLLSMISGIHSSNSLTSFPPRVNGSITACVGDEISLTCSRSDSAVAITSWIFRPPVNCSSDVTHNSQAADPPQCGPFTFMNISALGVANFVNSTAVGTASSEINGSKIVCTFGITMPVSVGNTSLCVTDTLPPPVNLRCMDSEVPRRLLVTWDVVTDGSSACARSSIIHDVTVVREDDGMMIFSMNNVKTTQIEITDSLETGQNYSIRVRTKLIHGTCETDEATITCRTSDDLSPTTEDSSPGHESSSDDVGPEIKNFSDDSATVMAVVVVVLVVIIITVIGVIIITVVFILICKRNGSKRNTERTRVEYPQNPDPMYAEILDPETDLEIATQQNVAYLDIKSTRSQRANRNAGASVSMATRNTFGIDASNEGRFYTEIPEADERLPNTEIPVSQNVAYLDLKTL